MRRQRQTPWAPADWVSRPEAADVRSRLDELIQTRLTVLGTTKVLPLRARWIAVTLVGIGIGMRVLTYAANRSLTLDESFLALNILRRGPTELLHTLDWNTGAPFAFLELEKALTLLIGSSELVLRAIPLVSSIVALLLFARVSWRILGPYVALLSIAIFCGFAEVDLYAAVTKQYSTDVAVGLAILLMTLRMLDDPGLRNLVSLGALGVVGPLLSHPAIFALAASAITILIAAGRNRNRRAAVGTMVIVGMWVTLSAGFYASYGEALSRLRQSLVGRPYLTSGNSLLDALGAARAIAGLGSSYNLFWRVDTGDVIAAFAGLAFLLGVARLASTQPSAAFMLMSPAVFASAASALHIYPLLPRTLLFITPTIALGLAEGIAAGATLLPSVLLRRAALAVGATIFLFSSSGAVRSVIRTLGPDDGMRRSINVLASEQRRTDTVYLSYAAQYPFAYYISCDCNHARVRRATHSELWPVRSEGGTPFQWSPALHSPSDRFVIGPFDGDISNYVRQLRSLRGHGRVWIVLTFFQRADRARIVSYLDTLGTRVRADGNGNNEGAVYTYLYEMHDKSTR